MDQLLGISLVFERVIKESICHAYQSLTTSPINGVSQLLEPHPIIGILSLRDLVIHQSVHNFNVVDDVQNKRFQFREKQHVSLVIETCIRFELLLKITLIIGQFALFNRVYAIVREFDHFGEATNLRWHVVDV